MKLDQCHVFSEFELHALKEAGIDTVEKVLYASTEDLLKIKGIGPKRLCNLYRLCVFTVEDIRRDIETMDVMEEKLREHPLILEKARAFDEILEILNNIFGRNEDYISSGYFITKGSLERYIASGKARTL